MSLVGRWTDLIYKVATGNLKTKLLLTPIVAALYLGLIAVFIVLAFFTDKLFHLPNIISYPWNAIVGKPLFYLGFILMILSIIYFIKVRGTPVPFNPPPKLVTTGPYKYARNPMLSGIFIQLFGLGIYYHSISLIFIFTPLFILLNVWELKKVEEPELERRFGQEYKDYKNKVSMFFPFF